MPGIAGVESRGLMASPGQSFTQGPSIKQNDGAVRLGLVFQSGEMRPGKLT
jgi:hypothetical protein